jgi:ubiquinone/menaquinone biosynthesis C-methylase UbiE
MVQEDDKEVRRFYETSNAGAYVTSGCLDIRKDSEEYVDRLLMDKLAIVTRHYHGGNVLDLCCATGQCLLTLAPTIESGIGLDFSTRYITFASERRVQMGLRNLSFVQGDAKATPFKTGEFSMVYCFSALYAIPQVDMAIAEISRILRPGGMAILDFGNVRSLSAYCSKFYTEWAKIYPVTRSAMHQYLSANGLRIVECRSFQILPLWADRPEWLKPLLHPAWKKMMSRRLRGKMLDEWASSIPGVRGFAFRHVLACLRS